MLRTGIEPYMIISKLNNLQAFLQAVGINDLVFAFKDGFFSKKSRYSAKINTFDAILAEYRTFSPI